MKRAVAAFAAVSIVLCTAGAKANAKDVLNVNIQVGQTVPAAQILANTDTSEADTYSAKLSEVISDTAKYLIKTVSSPTVGSIGGEWTVIALSRSGEEVPDGYFERYYRNVCEYTEERQGVLHEVKSTEYSRVILALTSIGKSPENVAGYNLLETLADYDATLKQGLNGPIWALIALDSAGYEIPENTSAKTKATRQMYVDYILECEIEGGGWALSKNLTQPDADITAMALTALSRYTEDAKVEQAVQRGINVLSKMQNENGAYTQYNSENSETAAQVLTAMSALGTGISDERFVKNGKTVADSILSYYNKSQGFSHAGASGETNLMATEQCLYALVAAYRFENGKNALFDMTDAAGSGTDEGENADTEQSFGLYGKHPDVRKTDVTNENKTFDDISGNPAEKEIEALAARGIINGKTDSLFFPDDTITRAEFAAITVRALGLPAKSGKVFDDVSETDWYFESVGTANAYGIIYGISDTQFDPNGLLTRQEAAVMVSRAAKLCGMDTEMELFAARNILAEFVDYVKLADWAVVPTAFCVYNGILDRSQIDLRPSDPALRSDVASMLYNLLGKAELL